MAIKSVGGDGSKRKPPKDDVKETREYQAWYKKHESNVMKKDPSIKTRNELSRGKARLQPKPKKKKKVTIENPTMKSAKYVGDELKKTAGLMKTRNNMYR